VDVYLGAGNNAFAPPVAYPMPVKPLGVAVADLDGDGVLDLAVAGWDDANLYLLRGRRGASGGPDGTFAAPAGPFAGGAPTNARNVAIADVNGDGWLDVAISRNDDTVGVFLGHGDGSFEPAAAVAVGHSPARISAVDLDGDGRLDVVVNNGGYTNVSVLWNTSP
jgi:hypothetical protein